MERVEFLDNERVIRLPLSSFVLVFNCIEGNEQYRYLFEAPELRDDFITCSLCGKKLKACEARLEVSRLIDLLKGNPILDVSIKPRPHVPADSHHPLGGIVSAGSPDTRPLQKSLQKPVPIKKKEPKSPKSLFDY